MDRACGKSSKTARLVAGIRSAYWEEQENKNPRSEKDRGFFRRAILESPLRVEGPAGCYHVIARRAKPDVAIPCSMERAENLRDCHAPMGLAMTWSSMIWNNRRTPGELGPTIVYLCHCEEPTGDVAIRIFPAPLGPGGALRRRGYGLPRPNGLAMTVVVGG